MVCGARGTGKSTTMKRIVDSTHYANVLIYLEPINIDEQTFAPIPVLAKLSDYAGGKAIVNAAEVSIYALLAQIEKNYRDGMVVIDEAGLYDLMIRNPNTGNLEPIKPLLFVLKNQRKINVTIYFVYHSLSEIPVRLIKFMNNFVLFHQTDEFKHKGSVIPRMDELKAMQIRIREKYFAGNRYYCERLQLQ
ncbi:MAG: hypothetical protein EBX41_00780 [Chitinophagia bacterium]|nr:hypothetical protein [Chitinophagia bacterium]